LPQVLQKAHKRMTFQLAEQKAASKSGLYAQLGAQLRSLLVGERDFIANTANCAALLFHALPDLNWAGFYFLKAGELVLGPFQGQPACVRIALGQGVCGTAAERRETVLVDNVHDFPGHIACDSGSNSEIVVPLVKKGRLVGVLDLDSPLFGRFDEADARGLIELLEILVSSADFQREEQMVKS
jgi:GAF domain-containing protein